MGSDCPDDADLEYLRRCSRPMSIAKPEGLGEWRRERRWPRSTRKALAWSAAAWPRAFLFCMDGGYRLAGGLAGLVCRGKRRNRNDVATLRKPVVRLPERTRVALPCAHDALRSSRGRRRRLSQRGPGAPRSSRLAICVPDRARRAISALPTARRVVDLGCDFDVFEQGGREREGFVRAAGWPIAGSNDVSSRPDLACSFVPRACHAARPNATRAFTNVGPTWKRVGPLILRCDMQESTSPAATSRAVPIGLRRTMRPTPTPTRAEPAYCPPPGGMRYPRLAWRCVLRGTIDTPRWLDCRRPRASINGCKITHPAQAVVYPLCRCVALPMHVRSGGCLLAEGRRRPALRCGGVSGGARCVCSVRHDGCEPRAIVVAVSPGWYG